MKTSNYFSGLFILFLSVITFQLSAQVGINNSSISPSGSAMLDIKSSDKGLLIPRLSNGERDQIKSPAAGLMIYNISSDHFDYYDGGTWHQIETVFASANAGSNSPGGGVAISNTPGKQPHASAMLDASDQFRGFLPARTTISSISNPENGLIIYDLSGNVLKYYFNNNWFTICSISLANPGASGTQISAGVAFNTTGADPDPSAIVDVVSPNKGILIPRLNDTERDNMLPATGLTIFNTTSGAIEYYNGSAWLKMNIVAPAVITIATNSTDVCSGIPVTFTANVVNGGSTPSFQWIVNGNTITGATNASYTYNPSEADQVYSVLTSNSPCATGSPATSNTITMTVTPVLPVSVSIAASANSVCAGTSVTYTATPVNGGTTPTYQWYKSGNPVGTNNDTYTYTPANGDQISVVLSSSITCQSGGPATSNTISMTVNPVLPVSVSVIPSANPVCAGTSVTFTASPVNGGATPFYQWFLAGTPAGTNSATYTHTPVNGNVVTVVLTSSETCQSGGPATSNSVTMTVNPMLPVGVSIAPSANPVCAGTSVTYTATPVNGGGNPSYQWYKNSISAGTNSATFSTIPTHGDVISVVMTSSETCQTGGPASSNTVTMTVHPVLPVSVSIVSSANPVCAGTSVTYTATPVNGGTTPFYQWYTGGIPVGTNSASYTHIPVNSDILSVVLTSNETCQSGGPATSNPITMTVHPILPVSVSVAPSANPVCAGTSVTFTAAPVNGGSSPVYHWFLAGIPVGTSSATYTRSPANGDIVSVMLTSNETCQSGGPATSNNITMTVNPILPVSVSIAPSANPVCAGTSVTYTATPVNEGANPSYQWYKNGVSVGTNSATYTHIPVDGNLISVVLNSSEACQSGGPALSNTITMTVHPILPVSVNIISSANPVCAGTSVTYTATPVNGGTTPFYQWYTGGIPVGTNSDSYTHVPVNSDVVSVVLTSSETCQSGGPATSNAITMTVHPILPVSVSAAPSANPVCAGTSVIFTASPVNGGSTPAYQWYLAGIPAGTNSATYTHIPVNGDIVSVVLTSNETCQSGGPASSNTVTMTVHPILPVSVSVIASANPVCAGTSVTFTATPVNGGTTPSYQWLINGNPAGTNSETFTYAPADGQVISVVLTSSETCQSGGPATSNTVTMVVHPLLTASIVITPSDNSICAETIVTYTSTIVNGGTSPAYQWRKNNNTVAGATNSSYAYAPLHNDVITCVLSSNAVCVVNSPVTSNSVVMVVNPLMPVSISISASANDICTGASVTFNSSIINGGSSPAYQWRVNGVTKTGATNASYTYVPVHNDAVTCILTSNALCATGTPATSNNVVMVVNVLLPVTITVAASVNPVCSGNPVTFTSVIVNGGSAPAYQWKVNGNTVSGATNPTYTYSMLNNDLVSCVLTSNAHCATGTPATSNTVSMTVIPNVVVGITIVPTLYNVMPGTSVTYTATVTNGGSAPVYQWKVNGTNSGTNSNVFTYTPNNLDKVTCVVTSNSTVACLINNPATSNSVAMVVYMTGSPCAGIPTVTYGTVTYNTVQIGSQCWFRESLNIGTQVTGTVTMTNNGTTEKYCYNNIAENCNIYGGLYQWGETVNYVNGASNTTSWNTPPTGNVQGICPVGWHVPTNTEWGDLMTSLGGQSAAGSKIKEQGLNHWGPSNNGATNLSGFTSLPGGFRGSSGNAFYYLANDNLFWFVTQGSVTPATAATDGGASYSIQSAYNGEHSKVVGESVRCLKN